MFESQEDGDDDDDDDEDGDSCLYCGFAVKCFDFFFLIEGEYLWTFKWQRQSESSHSLGFGCALIFLDARHKFVWPDFLQ